MEEGSLAKKEGLLYKRDAVGDEATLPHFGREREIKLPTSWSNPTPIVTEQSATSSRSFGVKLLLGSLGLLFLALLFTFWQFKASNNIVSNANILMTLAANPYVEGGERGTLDILVENKNDLPLLEAKAIILYEKGISQNNESKQTKETIYLGTIEKGALKKEQTAFTIYGAENEKRDILVRLEYKVTGSNAVFSKDTSASVIVRTPPVTVKISGDMTFTVRDTSNFAFSVTNNTSTTTVPLLLSTTFPVTFRILSASSNPYPKTTIWQIAPLAPGETRILNVRGVFNGAPGEKTGVKAAIGPASGDLYSIDPIFSVDTKDITLSAPGLVATIFAETDRGETNILRFGDQVKMRIRYENTGSSTLSSVNFLLQLEGSMVLPGSIAVDGNGYYDSTKGTIAWNENTTSALSRLEPGQGGEFNLSFRVPEGGELSAITFTLTGNGDNALTGEITHVTFDKRLTVEGEASLNGFATYGTGAIKNTGPIPPKVNQTTTYTLRFVASSQSDMRDAKIVFSLPVYVTWTGVAAPNTISYDSRTRLVTWNIGTIKKSQPVVGEVQVAVRPSETHRGSAPSITSGIKLTGVDVNSGRQSDDSIVPLTTDIREPGYGLEAGIVVGS